MAEEQKKMIENVKKKEEAMKQLEATETKKIDYLKTLEKWLSAVTSNDRAREWFLSDLVAKTDTRIAYFRKIECNSIADKFEEIKKSAEFNVVSSSAVKLNELKSFKTKLMDRHVYSEDVNAFLKTFDSAVAYLEGFARDSNAKQLEKHLKILEKDEVKHIKKYEEEIKFFALMQKRTETDDANWTNFRTMFRKKEKYKKLIQVRFGDNKTADIFLEFLKKERENRERFMRVFLPETIKKLNSAETKYETEEKAVHVLLDIAVKVDDEFKKDIEDVKEKFRRTIAEELVKTERKFGELQHRDYLLDTDLVNYFEKLNEAEKNTAEVIGVFKRMKEQNEWRLKAVTAIEQMTKRTDIAWWTEPTIKTLKTYSDYLLKSLRSERLYTQGPIKNLMGSSIEEDLDALLKLKGAVKPTEAFDKEAAFVLNDIKRYKLPKK